MVAAVWRPLGVEVPGTRSQPGLVCVRVPRGRGAQLVFVYVVLRTRWRQFVGMGAVGGKRVGGAVAQILPHRLRIQRTSVTTTCKVKSKISLSKTSEEEWKDWRSCITT